MSAFAWSYVCMAQVNRSMETAKAAKETLFLYAAQDYISNVDNRNVLAVRDLLLRIPNMNTTGRLPAMLLVCKTMRVRCTVTVCRRQAPVDSTGVVHHVELDPIDRTRWQQDTDTGSLLVLHHAPTILVKLDGSVKVASCSTEEAAVARHQ